ncbi:MAG: M15 family metallopeptidase [Candidatus Zipacnadales bacterium]
MTRRPRICEPIAALNRIRLEESGEPLVDIRRNCPHVRVSRRCIPFLRETVAKMVNRAQKLLPDGWRLWIRTALRTLDMQRDAYNRYFEQLACLHPDWDYATLRRMTNRYFAPVDQKAPPGHCTGGAVDVMLILPSGHPADLSSPFSQWEAPATFATGLTPRAAHNRTLLYKVMLTAGFSNCEAEYWHYSYGDAAWAVRTGADHCFYGLIEPPANWVNRRPDLRWARS